MIRTATTRKTTLCKWYSTLQSLRITKHSQRILPLLDQEPDMNNKGKLCGTLMRAYDFKKSEVTTIIEYMKQNNIPIKIELFNIIFRGISEHGNQAQYAEYLLGQVTVHGLKPDAFTWNTLMLIYLKAKETPKLDKIYQRMVYSGNATIHTFCIAISSCLELQNRMDMLENVFVDMQQCKVEADNGLLNHIVKGMLINGHVHNALQVFDGTSKLKERFMSNLHPDATTYSILIHEYRIRMPVNAQNLQMIEVWINQSYEKKLVDTVLLNTIINHFVEVKQLQQMEIWYEKLKVLAPCNASTYAILIKGYLTLANNVQKAEALLEETAHVNRAALTTILHYYAKRKEFDTAKNLYHKLVQQNKTSKLPINMEKTFKL